MMKNVHCHKRFIHSILLMLLWCALVGCFGDGGSQVKKEDELFENWVRIQLQGAQGWQASAAYGDVRQPELEKCVWQRSLTERDCSARESSQFPLFFRLPNGYLLSTGLNLPPEEKVSWSEIESVLHNVSGHFGFDEHWRPCLGHLCRFEVLTSYSPECPKREKRCGRAENIKVSYIIKSRPPNRRVWQAHERYLSNLDPSRKLEPLRFSPVNVIGLRPLRCTGPAALALSSKGEEQLLCGLGQTSLHELCSNPKAAEWRLELYGLCSFGTCTKVCRRIQNGIENPCSGEKMHPVLRSPDLFRCRGRSRFLYLARPVDFNQPLQAERDRSWVSKVFSPQANFCLTRTICFGAFRERPRETLYDVFLEVR